MDLERQRIGPSGPVGGADKERERRPGGLWARSSSRGLLAQRVQVLEDIEAIRKLKAAYCAACDDDHNGDAVAALFVPDGTWGAKGRPPEVGQDEIAAFMYGVRNGATMKRSAHQVFNPVIDVDGDTATGDWRFLMMYTATDEQSFVRIIGTYQESYVRTPDGWKFQSLEVTIEERGTYMTASSESH